MTAEQSWSPSPWFPSSRRISQVGAPPRCVGTDYLSLILNNGHATNDTLLLDPFPGVSVLRLLRAFRVFRLFKKIPVTAQPPPQPPLLGMFASQRFVILGLVQSYCLSNGGEIASRARDRKREGKKWRDQQREGWGTKAWGCGSGEANRIGCPGQSFCQGPLN